ncbi:Ty3-gypsy retrotransposon protein [Abeliophyllum distichum]|uniref:Ty3-gypsy retrotransposon protein n=1 Tax=Abeliophyllum distichum TaxID=126358 RepID=A0ABD1RV07_9LAMI
MIADTICAQYSSSPQSSLVYAKPYSRQIDEKRLPLGHQSLKFQYFGGKENLKQHVADFIETCKNTGTYNDIMVMQFVSSLQRCNVWYTDLLADQLIIEINLSRSS